MFTLTTETVINSVAQLERYGYLPHILELAQREEVEGTSLDDCTQVLLISIPELLDNGESVESVCIDLSLRYLSINQADCVKPLDENASDDEYMLINGVLVFRKLQVGNVT